MTIASIAQAEGDYIVEGVLHCTNPGCRREYPIIDGIPLVIASLRSYLEEHLLPVYARDDLSEITESMLGDCCGTGSALDIARQNLSSYAWDHYGDLDPDETENAPAPGAALRILEQACALVEAVPEGPIIDIGCSVGRTALALAERYQRLVLGVDLYYPTLRLATGVLRRGVVRYPRRRSGLVYDRREFAVAFPDRELVDIWACDAAALPFAPQTFAAAVGLNMLDSVRSPVAFLASMTTLLRPGGAAILSCPYDWSPMVTPVEAWIGGHSQRADDHGDSETVLRRLLTPGALPDSVDGIEIIAERHAVPWQVRLHERSTMTYKAHLVIARTTEGSPGNAQ